MIGFALSNWPNFYRAYLVTIYSVLTTSIHTSPHASALMILANVGEREVLKSYNENEATFC